jgi:hypothetical protein
MLYKRLRNGSWYTIIYLSREKASGQKNGHCQSEQPDILPADKDMNKTRAFVIMLGILAGAILVVTGGCKSKQEPAKITICAEGQDFSDAEIAIDGKAVGRLTQTMIRSNGNLYIDGKLIVRLAPDSPQRTDEDTYSGALDSVMLQPGHHTITLQTSEGKSLQIAAVISSGYHLIIYSSENETIKWDNETANATPGTTVNINLKSKPSSK